MTRDYKYVVLKRKDIHAALTDDEQSLLHSLYWKVDDYRYKGGRPLLKCVVVESDWPEYEPTWDAIERRIASSETPLTDAKSFKILSNLQSGTDEVVYADFARELEVRLAQAKRR